MILYRCFGWNEAARPSDPDGPLWVPRAFQGEGRHDNPDLYGCLYLADRAVSSIVEQLEPQARAIFTGDRTVAGIRWWSIYESLWTHVTLFDRAVPGLRVASVRGLAMDDLEAVAAADWLALPGRRGT